MTYYQDLWAHGKCLTKGYRECENRYNIIKEFCSNHFTKGFSVCDIGSNMNYFGIRLVEDFDCKIMSFEFHHFLTRSAHLTISGAANNIFFIDRKINLRDLKVMGYCCRFDLVLALSILHHVNENQKEWELALKRIGKYVIIEYAGEDSERAKEKTGHGYKDNGILLGYGDSHLEPGLRRKIVALEGYADGI